MRSIPQQTDGQKQGLGFALDMRWVRKVRRGLILCATFALLTPWLAAQAASQLSGSVTDASGASVSKAEVTLTEAATGFQRTTTSNASGLYQFLEVPPGDYKLEAAARGFAPFVVPKVTLVVKSTSTVNIKFQVAGGTTEVNVEGEAPLINRTDATLGNVIEQAQIAELPIADRNVTYLLSLQPGVAYLGGAAEANQATDTRSGAVNGVRSDQSNVTLDGIGVNDQNNGYAFTSVLNAPPDSVEEFRVTTANSNADAGYSSGGQVSLVTKSGTNVFHASAYEYNRNTIFSANDPFLKNSQLTSGQSNTAPKLLRNVFGVTVGGPILKNRLFFFANYEGRRDAEGSSQLRTVPSPTLRAGILEYLCADPTQCPGGTVTGVDNKQYPVQAGYNGLNFTQIKGMDPLGIGVNQAVLALLNQYPAANELSAGDGSNTLGFRFSPNVDRSFNTYITRLDYHITSNGSETLFARGEMQNFKEPGPQQFPGEPATTNLLDDSKGITVGLTSLLTPKLINDFHWGFIRQGQQYGGTSVYPGVFLSGIDSLVPFTRPTTAFVPNNQFSDSLSWTR
ncbi:MAG TPA: carboxypeptidase regulatory-like domain-containing protein, partial [Candidatus Sulfotelmatobacter sp.]|nr:carboxypeptidase regulatory-like domain-containing protein [Candidatus Sulfotelmatobacter sp.]